MPTSTSDFINTFINFGQYQLAKKQLADQEVNSRLAAIANFTNIARQTADPVQLTALVGAYSDAGVASPSQLTSLLSAITPTNEATQSGQVQKGVKVAEGTSAGKGPAADNLARQAAQQFLTNRDSGQLASGDYLAQALGRAGAPSQDTSNAAALRLLTQMTPGQMVLDHAKTMVGQPDLQKATSIDLGLTPNATSTLQNQTTIRGQNLQHDEALQNLNHAYAALNEQRVHAREGEAQGRMELELKGQQIDNELKAALNRAGAGGGSQITQLIETKNRMIQQLTDKNSKFQPASIVSAIALINSINQQLDASGIVNEGQLPYDPEILLQPGFLDKIFGAKQQITLQPRSIQNRTMHPDSTRKP